jgi:hypothetical protein
MIDQSKETPNQNHLFRIQYIDQTYQLVNWTNDQLYTVYQQMNDGVNVILMDKCIFKVADIRAITYLEPLEEEEKSTEEINEEDAKKGVVITEMGTYDKELFELLQSMGHDMGEIQSEKGVK